MTHGHEHVRPPGSGHEPNAPPIGVVLLFGVLTLGLICIAFVGVSAQLKYVRHEQPDRLAANAPGDLRPPPRVESWATPTADLAATRERERQHLAGYSWVDQSAGVVQIPIERAMDLVASEPASRSPEAQK